MGENNNKWIGRSVSRLEDPPLLLGRGRFAADISFAHQLHMRVVRSNHAHGKLLSIDTAVARALPGVFAVWTSADIADVPPIDFREGRIEKLESYRQPVLARERVRYVGEPVAAVFADDPYVAEDAAELVTPEIEELPVILSAVEEPGEFSPGRNTEATIVRQGYGDVDAVLRSAETVIELELAVGRHTGVPLETRGAIGVYDASRDMLELHGAAKVPHRVRDLLVRMLRRKTGIVIASRPAHNLMIAQVAGPGLKTVGLEQMNLRSHSKTLRKAMVRRYRRLDALAVLTEQDRGEYLAAMNGNAPPMWRLPNTVRDIEPPQADMTAKRILAAGRLTPQKGFDYLIHAFAPVAEAHADWELVIFGNGQARERLQARIDGLEIGDRVKLAGATETLAEEMVNASVYVLSSRYEGFPLVLIEAMAKGMAVVAFDCPTGPADIVDDHRNGLLVPAKDVEGLTAAMMEMVADLALRRRCAAAAVETARDYTMASIGPKWDEMLQALVQERG